MSKLAKRVGEMLDHLSEYIRRLKAENASLRAALSFYADEGNYWRSIDGGKVQEMTNADQGQIARDALREEV